MYTGITFATLRLFGTIPLEKEALNKVSKGLAITALRIFNIETGILYGPHALPSFKLEISVSVSVTVVGKI